MTGDFHWCRPHHRLACAVMYCSLTLCACGPSETPGSEGSPRLEFVRATSKELQLKLSNFSKNNISFRGKRDDSRQSFPWDVQVECKAADSTLWEEAPFSLIDGEANNVDLSPGEEVLVNVSGEFSNRFKGGTCHLSLRLNDGRFIASNDFAP